MQKLLVIVNFILVLCIAYCASTSPTVNIKNGALEGIFEKSRNGREFSAFKGIPYARPPIGQLRFQPPEPAESWSGVRDATKDSRICVQNDLLSKTMKLQVSEDCLYLNVYTPKMFNGKDPQTKYPVMVWIHGGSFMTGSGHSLNYSPKFLLDKDIVLVAINYRLGPLGFLSTGDDVIRGNQGLKDQVLALRWVQKNIAAFGGDPDSVTIFGESAGGASTHFLMISPIARGLFHRVISQSGTALGVWAINSSPATSRSQAHRLGGALNCPMDDSKQLRDCLLEKDAMELTIVDEQWRIFSRDPMIPFKPVVEVNLPGAFLSQHPVEIIRSGRMADVPWMTGLTSDEGALKTAPIYGSENEILVKQLNDNFIELAPITLMLDQICPKELHNKVAGMIRNYYLKDEPIDDSTRTNVTELYTDGLLSVSLSTGVREHFASQRSPIHFYLLAYRGTYSFSTLFGDRERDYGVAHADDLLYLFPYNEFLAPDVPPSADDEKMTDILTTLWYNFAKTGNPTPDITEGLSIKWKPVRTDALEYLAINHPQDIKMSENLWKERVEFWRSLPCNAGISIPSESPRRDEL